MHSKREVEAELEPGEHLLWSGQPKQGLLLRASDWFMIPFSLIWAGFVFVWEIGVLGGFSRNGGQVHVFMALFGIPFVVAGLYLVVGRFFVDARMRAKTYYALTDCRAFIVSGLFSKRVSTLPLDGMSQFTLTEHADGSGTITLGQQNPFAFMSEGMPWPGVQDRMVPSFTHIEDAKDVYRKISDARSAARAA